MKARAAALWLLAAACAAPRPVLPVDEQLALVELALREGRLEDASTLLRQVRRRAPRDAAAAAWSATLAAMLWDDDLAVHEQQVAVREARAAGADAGVVATLRGRLGDYLFQAGRWWECAAPLTEGAVEASATRRRAFAAIAATLPFLRKLAGPLLTEQALLPGDAPEMVCGVADRQRPFAIDTGTSMTTVARAFAEELGVVGLQPAGDAIDGSGRQLVVAVGVLPQFVIGDIEVGATPVLVVDDAALSLRDLHGGPERVPRGVLGLDLVAACRLTLDPERRSVVLELPRGLPDAGSVQCVRAEGRCLVPVLVEGARLWFVLDSGASHSSLTTAGLCRLPGGERRAVPTFRRVRGVGGSSLAVREVRDLVLQCSEARFESVSLPIVERGGAGLFPVHGVLGRDVLGQCRVTLDRGRLRLTTLS